MKGKIRRIREKDLIRCQDIIYACLNVACDNDEDNIELRKHYAYLNLERYIKSSKVFYVFESGGEVLGTGRVSNRNETRTLYVDPAYHKKGIGGEMLGRIEEFLKKIGRKKSYVHAMTSAIPFYEKQGYKKVKNFENTENRMEKKFDVAKG